MNKTLLLALLVCLAAMSFTNPSIYSFEKENHGDEPMTGFFIGTDNKQPYTLFSRAVKSDKDRAFFKVNGEVFDDDDVLQVGNRLKVKDPTQKGNLLTISNMESSLNATGTFDICPEIKELGLQVAGIASAKLAGPSQKESEIDHSDLDMEWMAGFDFNLPKDLMKTMMADFFANPDRSTLPKFGEAMSYQTAMAEWCTKEKKRAASIAGLQSGAPFRLSSEDTPGTFTLSELAMKWNPELSSFVSQNEKAVLLNMGKEEGHFYIDVKAEFCMPANKNDQLRLLLTSPGGYFYYFSYMNGILQTCSSNGAYNNVLINLSDKDKSVEVIKEQPYELQFGTAYVVKIFKERMGAD